MFCVPRVLNHPWQKVWQQRFLFLAKLFVQFVSQMKKKMVGTKKDCTGRIFFCQKHRGQKLFQSHVLAHLPLNASVLYFKNIQEFFLFVSWKISFVCVFLLLALQFCPCKQLGVWLSSCDCFFFSFWNTVSWIVSGSDTKKHRQTSIMASSALRNSL